MVWFTDVVLIVIDELTAQIQRLTRLFTQDQDICGFILSMTKTFLYNKHRLINQCLE